MSWRIPIAVAVAVVILVTIITAILNRGLAHAPYTIGIWSVLALAGLALYWAGWSIRRKFATHRNRQV